MSYYQNTTFCNYYINCKVGKRCPIALTYNTHCRVLKQFNQGRCEGSQVHPPVSVYSSKPKCFKICV